ncbi:MAG: NUDIX hydrolase [Gemmatimonadetes bacterium]|nr:NUDIX hydrolase [Gemmatimonadota bacterium]
MIGSSSRCTHLLGVHKPMPMSDYFRNLRAMLGPDLLVLPSVSIAHIDDQDRLLLMHFRDTGKWGLPGGVVEPHEHPATAAVREMWEETGLHVRLTGILSVYGGPEMHVDYPNGDQVSYVSTVFGCEVTGGVLQARDGEALDLAYCDRSKAESLNLAPWTRTLLPHLFAQDTPAFFTPSEWSPDE